jgi:hypothetical protein
MLQEKMSGKRILIYSVLLVILAIVKYQLSISAWYDGPKLEGVRNLTPQTVVAAFSSGQLRSFFPLLLQNYWVALILFFSGMLAMLLKKRWRLFFLTLGVTAIYFFLIGITYPAAFTRTSLFYMESEWMALAIIIGTPFAYFLWPQMKPAMGSVVLILLFSIRFYYIQASATLFEKRYTAIGSITQQLHARGINKAVLIKDLPAEHLFLTDWGTPVESLLYSSLQGYEPQVSFKLVDNKPDTLPATDRFISCFEEMQIKALNARYFKLDTSKPYQVLPLSQFLK